MLTRVVSRCYRPAREESLRAHAEQTMNTVRGSDIHRDSKLPAVSAARAMLPFLTMGWLAVASLPGRGAELGIPHDQVARLRSVAVLAAAGGAPSPARSTSGDVAEQVEAATRTFYEALNRADPVEAARFLLPGGNSFPRSGAELDPEAPSAEESLRNLQRGFASGLRFHVTLRDLRVQVFGEVGIATFYTNGMTTAPGRLPANGEYRATYVWVRTPQGWKIAHFHISPLIRS